MLCFVFATLVVLLDQFFKHWIMRTVDIYGHVDLIPGVIGLTHIQNSGAAFSLLSDQRWLLVGISLIAAIVLVFILLRYTDGFWGTIGLAAVLGGTVGNLIDRVFQGYVVDMFRPLFVDFAIFNVADIFITLGFTAFCAHFISMSIRSSRREEELADGEYESDGESGDEDPYSIYDVPDSQEVPDFDALSDTKVMPARKSKPRSAAQPVFDSGGAEEESARLADSEPAEVPQVYSEPMAAHQADSGTVPGQRSVYAPEPQPPSDMSSTLDALEALESELGLFDDYDSDTDALLREYGFE